MSQRRKTFDKDLDTIYDSSQTSISRSPDRNSMSPLSGGTQFTSLVEVLLITALNQQQQPLREGFISNTCSISCQWGETLSLLFSRNRRLAMLTIFYGRPGNSISSYPAQASSLIHPSVSPALYYAPSIPNHYRQNIAANEPSRIFFYTKAFSLLKVRIY